MSKDNVLCNYHFSSSSALALPSAATALGASRVSEIFETVQSQEDAAHEAMLSRHVKLSDTATATVKSAAPCRAFKFVHANARFDGRSLKA